MKIIERKEYLEKLNNVMNTPDIKVITGIRRSGKSKLLDCFIEKIKIIDKKANIIHIDYNDDENENLKEYHELLKFVKDKYQAKKNNYLCIDEVQMCVGFEKAINSLHNSEKFDIYITGSNAFLLSSDLATLFTGRVFEIEVFPFSYDEFLQYYKLNSNNESYNRYLKEGGMSGSYLYKTNEDKLKYAKSIFETLILRDIVQKYKIKNELLLMKIVDYLTDNISNLTSIRKLTDEINGRNNNVDHKTVGRYIDYLCKAFAFYKVKRYDIVGKKYLSTSEKYYIADHLLRMARIGTKNPDYGRVLENIVAIELLRRGYEIYVGMLYKKEIDFVAIKNDEKIYIQVSNSIDDEKTKMRELEPLQKIKDSNPKMIITRTNYPEYNIEGIKIIDISEWLKIE